jgi:hypothetical protein
MTALRARGLLAGLLLAALPSAARAGSLGPELVSETSAAGEALAASAAGAPVDVLFLFDATGSMAPFLASAQAGAGDILAGVAGLGDLAFGVGAYQDFPLEPFGGASDFPYALLQDLSPSAAAAAAAIASLALGFGADAPEAQLHALAEAAGTASWRAGSTRILLWFGEAPGHDGDLESSYPSGVGLADAIAALEAERIAVQAFDLADLDAAGQASAIAGATGGSLFAGVDPEDLDEVTQIIRDAAERPAAVPEPGAAALFALGALVVAARLQRR